MVLQQTEWGLRLLKVASKQCGQQQEIDLQTCWNQKAMIELCLKMMRFEIKNERIARIVACRIQNYTSRTLRGDQHVHNKENCSQPYNLYGTICSKGYIERISGSIWLPFCKSCREICVRKASLYVGNRNLYKLQYQV